MRAPAWLRIMLATTLFGIAASTPALAQKSVLRDGEYLQSGQYLANDTKTLFAIMQGDGNFCAYRGSGPANNKGFVYCTQTNAGAGAYFATMQGDGNFCIYRGAGPADNRGNLRCTGRTGGAGRYFAILQNDGNFAIYRGTGPADNKGLLWDLFEGKRMGAGDAAKMFFSDPKSAFDALRK